MRRHIKPILLIAWMSALSSCSFNFEITSQRTAIENQILGNYSEINNDGTIKTSLEKPRASNGDASATTGNKQLSPSQYAALNQQFNKADLEDLKNEQIIGESASGDVQVLPKNIGLVRNTEKETLKLADIIALEENKDRAVLLRAKAEQQSLDSEQMKSLKIDFVNQLRLAASVGHWLQDEKGQWYQKVQDHD